MPTAVWPVNATSAPVMPAVLARMSRTSVSVASSVGPVFGITASSMVVWAWLIPAGATASRLGSPVSRSVTLRAASAAPCGVSAETTSTSRPLKPGPKPVRTSSKAVRSALPTGAWPASGSAIRMSRAGSARMPSTTTPSRITGTRNRVTARAQRKPNEPWSLSSSGSAARTLRGSIRRPAKPSSAGWSVIATSTATATVPAAARPIVVRNGMFTTARPASAITTVAPANTTAEPAVPTARATASSAGRPARRFCRCRELMNSE
jgi:hypothetical protein